MGNLAVQVSLFDQVIEHRVVTLKEGVLLGDHPAAAVVFPFEAFPIKRTGDRVRLLGKTLAEGETLRLEAGTYDVEITHTVPRWRQWHDSLDFDRRFLAVTLVMALSGGWIDAAGEWISRETWTGQGWSVIHSWRAADGRKGEDIAPAAALVRVPDAGTSGIASPSKAEGPQHLSDDRVTGVGYHRWFKEVVPTDPNAMEANRRLNLDPDDSEARRIVGRAAYNAGRFRLAAWHYGQLVERFPADHHARLRLAWAERRQGLHRNELDHYEVILNRYPGHALALSGKSMAAARLGRFVEAQALVEQLHVVAPTHPYTDVTSAVLEAVRGQDNDALRSIRRAVEGRDRLDEELQVELRRDIATDPAFLPLRNHWRLRAVLRRHFAAASPRGTK